LRDYEKTTDVSLTEHPLAEGLRDCHSVESVTTFLQDLARELGDFPGSERIVRSIENTVSLLCTLSGTAVLRSAVSFVRSEIYIYTDGKAFFHF
jgi:hypothetical protein